MADIDLTTVQKELIDELVAVYVRNQGPIKRLLDSLDGFISDSESLAHLIHSVKKRMKEPSHLKAKLIKKLRKSQEAGRELDINKENLLTEIIDLGGYRILHLHTRQMDAINRTLLPVLKEEAQCTVIEGPKANVWDQESKAYFESIGIKTEYNPRMYSSVHYVVQPNNKAKVTIEIQVRTLSEEIWGEVDHKFNYPQALDSVACGEQIKVLARVASSCTRLVDSIFASYADWQTAKGAEYPVETAEAIDGESSTPTAESESGDVK
jgi:ppGpp synthetase/RelA/SpoT-type nucleotidyltranferase